MNTKKRHVIAVLGSVIGAAALSSSVALAGNCTKTPPGQAKHESTGVAAGASVSTRTTARGHAKHEASVAAGASVSGKATTRGRSKHQSASVVVSTSASNATGVKSSSTTGFDMHAAAASNATKRYGNGRTAGQIAVQNGAGASAMLFGPGNSQPHKAALCSTLGVVRLVDVHALKAHGVVGSCIAGATSSTGSAGASSSGSVAGSVSRSVHGMGSVHGQGIALGTKAHVAARTKAIRLHRSRGVLGLQHSVNGSVTAQAKPARAVLGTASFTG